MKPTRALPVCGTATAVAQVPTQGDPRACEAAAASGAPGEVSPADAVPVAPVTSDALTASAIEG